MADKESTERRVYVLPSEQLERIRAYQTANSISAEVEAVRRLLDLALQNLDTIHDILKKLRSRYADEKDLRVLARDILTTHVLVLSVHFLEDGVSFYMAGEMRGKITKDGTTYIAEGEEHISGWTEYPRPAKKDAPRPAARSTSTSGPSWDAPRGGDLDDEIPF
jgi:hypothetical protein